MKNANSADEESFEEELSKEYAWSPISVMNLYKGFKIGKFLLGIIEKVFPFLKVKDENYLSKKDFFKMAVKLAFLIAFACWFVTEIAIISYVLFNSNVNKLEALVYAPLVFTLFFFTLFLIGGAIGALRWNVKTQS